jgi:hypothetical protein
MSYAIFELRCPTCELQYAQMLSDADDHLPIPCPSCDADLQKGKKLTGAELLACGFSVGGG